MPRPPRLLILTILTGLLLTAEKSAHGVFPAF